MVVTTLWPLAGSYILVEWEGRNDRNEFVHLRCQRGTIELRAHPAHRPGMDDVHDIVDLEDFDYMTGETPTYAQVRQALLARGHTLPARDDSARGVIPDRPLFPGYEGPGNYVRDRNTGTFRRAPDGPLPRFGICVGGSTTAGPPGNGSAGDPDQAT